MSAVAPVKVPGVGFVGVHIGAGQHSEARTAAYLGICASACARAIKVLRAGGSAIEASAQATAVLEDPGETNAGFGSNLTKCGTVEMDAGLMDGSRLLFGAVGAMPGVKNPILVAKQLVVEQNKGLLPLGRVPPMFMVGEGAREWAERHGIKSRPQEELVSEKADRLFKYYKKKLDSVKEASETSTKPCKKRKTEEEVNGTTEDSARVKSLRLPEEMDEEVDSLLDDRVTDTVGVVVMDQDGNVASTVSSGGIALKQPGRVGQAACFGCGCWAQNRMGPAGVAVGVSTTGCGEHLVRTFLARECANVLARRSDETPPLVALRDAMCHKFAESEFLSDVGEKLGGAICLRWDPAEGSGQFLWTHTTHSMGVAFQTTECVEATAKMSRLPKANGGRLRPNNGSTTILVQSVNLKPKGGNSVNNDQVTVESVVKP